MYRYFYGEIVQGNAHIEIKLEVTRTAQPTINKSVKVRKAVCYLKVVMNS